ncbi:uncharacterized protein LOC143037793 [Oratosquilla oratoria]|uniref:uncharacterized protein LOC143037793 n=1 Tax=Oratosquilla oratoria TaxID=337810 RepID=UPI003F75B116
MPQPKRRSGWQRNSRAQETQQQLREGRLHHIGDMMAQADETDEEFTLGELMAARRPDKDTAPGEDGVTYSMLAHLGPAGDEAFFRVINASWRAWRLPTAWKTATIVSIPKSKEPGAYRPISLVSCIGKTAERIVLNRLLWKLGPLHCHPSSGSEQGALHRHIPRASPSGYPRHSRLQRCEGQTSHLDRRLPITQICARVVPRPHVGTQGAGKWFTTGRVPQSDSLQHADLQCIGAPPLPRRYYDKAQRCLDAVVAEYVRIGLKISPRKSKAMTFGLGRGKEPLVTQGFVLDWVTHFQYLGVWVDKGPTFNREISHLRERMTARTKVMRAICGRTLGATHQVLRTYYVQAVPSIANYAAPALLTVAVEKLQRLETCQNEAARIILGAQRLYKVLNLQREASLPPLQLRIRMLGANFVACALHPREETGLSRAVYISLERADTPHPPTPGFLTRPSFWIPFNCVNLSSRRAYQNSTRTLNVRRRGHRLLPNAAGAAFVTDGCTFGRRVSDSASSLQVEAVAMQGALEHTLASHSNSVVIHTDSLNLMSCLQHAKPEDNVHLLTNIITLLHKLQSAGRNVIINWVPSHVVVHGNDLANATAAAARKRPKVDVQVPPSRSQLKLRTRALARTQWHLQHSLEAQIFQRAGWYKKSAIKDCRCNHCRAENADLLHYLSDCLATSFLKRGPPAPTEGLVSRLCRLQNPYELCQLLGRPPPL